MIRGAYAFGDGDVPARRLGLLASVFEASSRRFLAVHGVVRPRLALDLGCGPGHTTRLVAATLRPRRTLGLDASPDFVARAAAGARAGAPPRVEFAVHDVARRPFPTAAGPPELVYARLLVAHLEEPEAAIAAWSAQLAPAGRLLMEEVEAIETEHPVLAEYLARVVERLDRAGQRMVAGPLLARVADAGAVATVEPPVAHAAAMFRMNLDTWCDDEAVHGRLAPALDGLLEDPRTGVITWRVRQAVVESSRR
ncbi:MAG TPA: class I SAM-dependent methyltransferase, partial [Candidatus Dormibacteraeota bacterium]